MLMCPNDGRGTSAYRTSSYFVEKTFDTESIPDEVLFSKNIIEKRALQEYIQNVNIAPLARAQISIALGAA